MNEDKAIVPYQKRKTYQIGDGTTRFTEPGELPLTSEEKYQKPPLEVMLDLQDAITDTSIAIINAFEPVFKAMTQLSDELMKVPEFRACLETTATKKEKSIWLAEASKAAARERSRADVRDKRKLMMKRRGRK